jgi:uncharacterized membrane protein
MFGFAIGIACLIGLIFMLRRPRWHGRFYCGRSPLYAAFEHLDTSPAQEKVIREAFDEVRQHTADFKEELRRSRRDFASVLRSDTLDEASLDQLIERQQANLSELGGQVRVLFGRIHETLDERQRRRLADWLESSSGYGSAFRKHGPYRGMA